MQRSYPVLRVTGGLLKLAALCVFLASLLFTLFFLMQGLQHAVDGVLDVGVLLFIALIYLCAGIVAALPFYGAAELITLLLTLEQRTSVLSEEKPQNHCSS